MAAKADVQANASASFVLLIQAPGTRARALRVLGDLLESAKISNSVTVSAIHAAIEASLTVNWVVDSVGEIFSSSVFCTTLPSFLVYLINVQSDAALVREAALSTAADCILNDSSLGEQWYEPILFACKGAQSPRLTGEGKCLRSRFLTGGRSRNIGVF